MLLRLCRWRLLGRNRFPPGNHWTGGSVTKWRTSSGLVFDSTGQCKWDTWQCWSREPLTDSVSSPAAAAATSSCGSQTYSYQAATTCTTSTAASDSATAAAASGVECCWSTVPSGPSWCWWGSSAATGQCTCCCCWPWPGSPSAGWSGEQQTSAAASNEAGWSAGSPTTTCPLTAATATAAVASETIQSQ